MTGIASTPEQRAEQNKAQLKFDSIMKDLVDVESKSILATHKNLSGLFKKYFNDRVDIIFSKEDIEDLESLLGYENSDIEMVFKPNKRGVYVDETGKAYPFNVTIDANIVGDHDWTTKPYVSWIGVSTAEQALYFHFEMNTVTGYPKGSVYVRKSAADRIKFMMTFDVITDGIGTKMMANDDGDTREVKYIGNNVTWLTTTIEQMEKHIFIPTVQSKWN